MRPVPSPTILAVAVLGTLAVAAAAPAPADLTAAADRLEQALIATCCFHHTVAEHRSPESDAVRVDIRRRLAGGESEAAILAAYEQRYGERILAAPRLAGFGLLAWVTPWVVLAGAAGLVWRWLRRHRRERPAVAGQSGAVAAELARLDA